MNCCRSWKISGCVRAGFDMEPTLLEILDAREKRAEKQKQLLSRYGQPLLCFTMNIPGPVKLDRDIRLGFYVGCRLLDDALRGLKLLYREEEVAVTGCQAWYVVEAPARQLKEIAVDLEETDLIGRLFDMDVLDTDGKKLSREDMGKPRRKCLLCNNDAAVCARSRAHGLEQLQDRTGFLLYMAARQYHCEYIAVRAWLALQQEVSTTPKPGLVDRSNNGAHKDMDLRHFFISANALRPYFADCAREGYLTRDLPPEETFQKLRPLGMEAEKTMLEATGGVNTHKGAIFSLGLLCAAAGRLPAEDLTPEKLLRECAVMTKGLTERDLGHVTRETAATAGEKLYALYGVTGIRGQAEAGFPAVRDTGLPVLRQGLKQGLSLNDAGCATLLHLLCAAEDTNLIKRGGMETAQQIRQEIRVLLDAEPYPAPDKISALDGEFIKKNLSPGGSADLLALTYFLHFLCR